MPRCVRQRAVPSAVVWTGLVAVLWCTTRLVTAEDSSVVITPQQEKFFEEKVRPLLANHCLDCHGAQKQESGLRLDSRQSVLKGGDSGEPAAVAGHPEQSLL